MDQQTKDEKEFLDEELFDILQEVKGKMERGELDENHENASNDGVEEKPTLGKLGKLAVTTKENAQDAQEEYAVEEGRDIVPNKE